MPVGALIGSVAVGVGGSVLSSNAQSKAAGKASDAQVQATQLAVDAQERMSAAALAEQKAAREQLQQLLAPYVAAGGPALQGQLDYLGLGSKGAQGQQDFINQQKNNPIFQGLLQQGTDTILQNASATGGLRGGNTQSALGSYSSQLLNQFVTDQYNRLGGITQLGQNSAAGVGAGYQNSANAASSIYGNTANAISGLYGDMGAAQAGGYLAQGNAKANMYNGIASGIGSILGMGGF